MKKVLFNAFRIRPVANKQNGDDPTVLAELVPTTVLLDRIPGKQRVGDYLLDGPPRHFEESVFDPESWDGVYNDNAGT